MTSIDDIPIEPDRKKEDPVFRHLSVGISLVALTISIASLWLGTRNAELQREVSRPLLSVSQGPRSDHEGEITVGVNLTNIGHITAVVTGVEITPVGWTWKFPDGSQEQRCSLELERSADEVANPESHVLRPSTYLGDIDAGGQQEINYPFYLPKGCKNTLTKYQMFVRVTLKYRDRLDNQYEEVRLLTY